MYTKLNQLELFSDDRLPRKPYCADDFAHGVRIRSLKQALNCKYIQINPPHLRFWLVFDIDRAGGAMAWEDAKVLPYPAWSTVNKANGHAHTAWGLSAPVLIGDNARNAPIRYLAAIEAAYTALLEADTNYSGLITKNPLNDAWRLLVGVPYLYTLDELARNIDLPDLRKFRPRREKDAVHIGVGRNCYIFDLTRIWSYKAFREYVLGDFKSWYSAVEERAFTYNGDLPVPLAPQEVGHIVQSVSTWIWRHFDLSASDARFSALQAHRGAKGGKANGQRNKHVRELAIMLLNEGKSTREVATECGVNQSTVSRWSKVMQKP